MYKKEEDKRSGDVPKDGQGPNEGKNQFVREVAHKKYEYGFSTDVQTEIIERGLNEDVVRLISSKKEEPEWLLEFRLQAFRYWQTQKQPSWAHLKMPEIDYQAISYYADPTKGMQKDGPKSLDEIDPELMKTFDKLGIPLEERLALSGTAVDAVMDSVSVKTTFKEKLSERGIIFCSISEAVREYPDLVKQYLGSVVPYRDNYFAALNSAVFSDGSFVYIPKGVRCPMELSTYFRINARNTGQFERTLIVCDDGGYVSYLEGGNRGERKRRGEVQYGTKLVSGRCRRARRRAELSDEARAPARGEQQTFVDAGGDRFRHYLEISQLHLERRPFPGRVLQCGCDQQLPTGRYGHEDDSLGARHEEYDYQ